VCHWSNRYVPQKIGQPRRTARQARKQEDPFTKYKKLKGWAHGGRWRGDSRVVPKITDRIGFRKAPQEPGVHFRRSLSSHSPFVFSTPATVLSPYLNVSPIRTHRNEGINEFRIPFFLGTPFAFVPSGVQDCENARSIVWRGRTRRQDESGMSYHTFRFLVWLAYATVVFVWITLRHRSPK
jgi:hypothetical protein